MRDSPYAQQQCFNACFKFHCYSKAIGRRYDIRTRFLGKFSVLLRQNTRKYDSISCVFSLYCEKFTLKKFFELNNAWKILTFQGVKSQAY